MPYSLHAQKEWLRSLFTRGNVPADQSHFDDQYETALDVVRNLKNIDGAQALANLLPNFDEMLAGSETRHNTPSEKNFLMMRNMYLLMIAASEVVQQEVHPPDLGL